MTDGWLMDAFGDPLDGLPHVAALTRCTWCGGEGWPFLISTPRNGCGDVVMTLVCCPCCAVDDADGWWPPAPIERDNVF